MAHVQRQPGDLFNAMKAKGTKGKRLTTKARNSLSSSSFALPGRRYPINDANHARNALARVSQHGSSSEKARVRAAVHNRYPGIGKKKRKAAIPDSGAKADFAPAQMGPHKDRSMSRNSGPTTKKRKHSAAAIKGMKQFISEESKEMKGKKKASSPRMARSAHAMGVKGANLNRGITTKGKKKKAVSREMDKGTSKDFPMKRKASKKKA